MPFARREGREPVTMSKLHGQPAMGRTYTGLIHKDPDSDYGVSFPDLPGCITAGRTLEEAREMAAEALALHQDGLAAYGEEIPKPSSADTVIAHPDARDALAILVVEAMPVGAEVSAHRVDPSRERGAT